MADNLNRLRMAHERYRQSETDRRQTDGRATANSEREREFTFAKNHQKSMVTSNSINGQHTRTNELGI